MNNTLVVTRHGRNPSAAAVEAEVVVLLKQRKWSFTQIVRMFPPRTLSADYVGKIAKRNNIEPAFAAPKRKAAPAPEKENATP